MKKIMVIGSSAGAGKSTFARRLSERLNIPVCHIDTLYWRPGWVEEEPELFRAKQKEFVQKPSWIIEGNYRSTMSIRLEKADTIICIHQPLWLCLYRVFKRRMMYQGKSRPDLTVGCDEKIDLTFLLFIIKTYYPRKKTLRNIMNDFKQANQQNQTYSLHGSKEIDQFLKSIG